MSIFVLYIAILYNYMLQCCGWIGIILTLNTRSCEPNYSNICLCMRMGLFAWNMPLFSSYADEPIICQWSSLYFVFVIWIFSNIFFPYSMCNHYPRFVTCLIRVSQFIYVLVQICNKVYSLLLPFPFTIKRDTCLWYPSVSRAYIAPSKTRGPL